MPLTRYQIRNEYSLADPELYRAADKDDPEAVLEGVAMAGLVGLLRQLGDLAEFAAQIFHDLHEEVMATSARGHGLMLRVQQLEAEVPSVEKAFLTQTSHSLFLLNAGVDWHPNLRMDENLITREDLPRSVMDSYEECRGPPRLFLLDKYDVSGAGTCLKRYSDPSFFKAKFTFSETMGTDIQREKKARKVKKKGSRWRNGENPEYYPTSHAKLHQLLSEERNSDNNVLVHHVKLKKRQLNGFSSESTTGKSYMERFVETNSPERACENSLVLPKLDMESSNTCEQGLEIREISTASPASELMEREIGLISSTERQETALEQSMYDLHEDVIKEGILEKLHEPMCDIEVEKLPSSLYKLEDQNKLVVDVERQKEVDGYQSDDFTSEMDNYMDALATMESEMETDTDTRPNNDQGFINIKRLGMNPDTKELQKHQDQLSDSHSVGSSSESGDYNLFKKGRYSPSNMDAQSNLTVKGHTGHDAAAEVATSGCTCPTEIVDISSEKPSANDYALESLEYVVPGGSSIEVSEIPSSGSELVETSPDSCVTDSTSTISHHLSPGANLNDFQLQGPDFVGYRGSSSNTEEDTENLVADVTCTINLSDSDSKMKDDTLSKESGKSQQVEVIDGLSCEISSDALLHQSDISGLVVARKYDGGTFDTVFPIKCDEEAPTDNFNRNSDSPYSITLATEEQLSCLEGRDIEVCSSTKQPECLRDTTNTNDLDDLKSDRIVETDTGIQTTRENPEYASSALDIQKAHNFAKQGLSEMTEEVPPQVDLEVGIGNSGVETLYNDLEVSSNTTDGGVSDEPALEVGQSKPGGSVGKDVSSPEFPCVYLTPDSAKTAPVTDHSLQMGILRDTVHAEADTDSVMHQKLIGSWNCIKQQEECPLRSRDLGGSVSDAYAQLDDMESARVDAEAGDEDNADCGCLNGSRSRNDLKLEDKCPASDGNVSDIENEVHSKLENLTTGADHAEANVDDIAGFPNQNGSLSKIQMKSHEECLRNAGSEQFKLETTEAHNPEFVIGDDSQKEINQLAAASTNLDVQMYNSESHGLSSSEFPYDVHVSLPVQHPQSRLHLMDITEVPKSSVEMDEELQFAQQIQPSESAEDPICTSLSNNELRIPSEQAQVLEASQPIVESLDGERESPLLSNLLDEQTESPKGRDQDCCPSFPSNISWFERTEPVKHRGPDGSSDGASEFSCGDPLKRPLDFPSVPTSQKMLTHEPTIEPWASSFPSFGMLSGTAHEQSSKPQPSQGPNAAQANLEEPPLPPLPPLQWRVGKFQHSSPTAEGEMVQPSLNPFLPQGFRPFGGEIVQPLNPFLPLNSREGKHQHGSKVLGEDIVHPDLNPFSSQLPAVLGDTNNNKGSQTTEVEEIQLPNLLSSLPATEDEKLEHDLLPSGGEKAQPSLNSFAPSPATEEDQRPSDTLLGESCDVQNLSEPEPNMNDGTIKDEAPLNLFTPPVVKEEESLNSFAPSPATEERPPSDTLRGESCDVQNLLEPEQKMNDGTVKDEEPLKSFTPPIRKEGESLNSFAPLPATEENRPSSDTLQGKSCDLQDLSGPEPSMNDGTTKDEHLNSYAPLITKEESSLNSFLPPTIKEEPLNSFAPPNIKHVEPADGSLMLEGEMPSNASMSFPDGEVGVPNGKTPKKQPRPRDPLIEAVASHERSMLRKATERASPKVEHKIDSMLEQIRTKSFNLRPAVRPMLTTRPSFQGPRTNLNVAAILEKANAIRQATAGSDEDDNDSWSDS